MTKIDIYSGFLGAGADGVCNIPGLIAGAVACVMHGDTDALGGEFIFLRADGRHDPVAGNEYFLVGQKVCGLHTFSGHAFNAGTGQLSQAAL